MIIIQLTPEQSALMCNANDTIYLHDSSGKAVGTVKMHPDDNPFTPEEIEEYQRRAKSPGPRYTTAQVLDHLMQLAVEGK